MCFCRMPFWTRLRAGDISCPMTLHTWTRLRAYVTCPYCHATDSARLILSYGNLLRGMVNLILAVIIGEPVFPTRLRYRCRYCGGRFEVDQPKRSENLCRVCDYDLTGNVSGVCPECGTPIDPERGTRCE